MKMSVKARFSINMLVILFSLWSEWMAITTKTFPAVKKEKIKEYGDRANFRFAG